MNKIFYVRCNVCAHCDVRSASCTVICILTVTVTLQFEYSLPSVEAYAAL